MTNSIEFILSSSEMVLELLTHALAANGNDIRTATIVADALTVWLKYDLDGSRATVKSRLMEALSLPPGSVPDVVPDAAPIQPPKHEVHFLKVRVIIFTM